MGILTTGILTTGILTTGICILPMGTCQVPPVAVDTLFDSFDKDGGGAINFRELNHLLRRNVKKEVKVVKPVYTVKILDVQQARKDSALRWTKEEEPTIKASDPGEELLKQLLKTPTGR